VGEILRSGCRQRGRCARPLKIGDKIVGSHGIVEAGEKHENSPYTIVGLLAPNGSVLDRLLLTSVESVWEIHGQGPHDKDEDEEGNGSDASKPRHLQPQRRMSYASRARCWRGRIQQSIGFASRLTRVRVGRLLNLVGALGCRGLLASLPLPSSSSSLSCGPWPWISQTLSTLVSNKASSTLR